MSLGYVFVRSGVAVDSNGECRKKSNRERVTKVLVRIRPAMRKPSQMGLDAVSYDMWRQRGCCRVSV